jgi:hypothetical protein
VYPVEVGADSCGVVGPLAPVGAQILEGPPAREEPVRLALMAVQALDAGPRLLGGHVALPVFARRAVGGLERQR